MEYPEKERNSYCFNLKVTWQLLVGGLAPPLSFPSTFLQSWLPEVLQNPYDFLKNTIFQVLHECFCKFKNNSDVLLFQGPNSGKQGSSIVSDGSIIYVKYYLKPRLQPKYLTTTQLPDYYPITWLQPNYNLNTTWQQTDYNLTTTWLQPDCFKILENK